MSLTSVWQDRHPRTAAAPGPDEVSGRYDVAVVGAGLTGLTTALLLARAGRPTAKISCLQGSRLSTIARVCTHLGGIVRWNDAEPSWDCPLHGSRFDHHGQVLEGLAVCGLRRPRVDPPQSPPQR